MRRIAIVTALIFLAGILLSTDIFAEKREAFSRKEFEVKPGGRLRVDLKTGGDLVVTGWDKDRVLVEVFARGRNKDNIKLEIEKSRGGVEIKADFEKRRRRNNIDMVITVSVPKEYDVKFETVGGDIEISGVRGEFSGQTCGGDMEFADLRGRLKVTTLGGDISVKHSELDGYVKTLGGDVGIDDVTGDLKGSTLGGDVTYNDVKRGKGGDDDDDVSISTFGGDLNLDYEGKNVKAKTFGGDIEVGRAKEVNVSTFGGDIDVDEAPMGANVSTMGGDITVNSAGRYVKAKTMGGDIDIAEIDGWVYAKTMGGDVTVEMVGDPSKGKRDVELKSMGGDIELTVPEGLSMEFDIEIAYTKGRRHNYRIESDFKMNIRETDEWKRKWGQKRKYIYGTGEVGGGENHIKIRTVNGNIFIKKR